MKLRFTLIIALAFAFLQKAKADEGMWMIHNINSALEKKMQERGLCLSAKELYNADAPGASISDAVVSMEFGCTGSIISNNGLLITNHHCAYGDIHSLSTLEHNYLEDGFWAFEEEDEVNIKGKRVFFLKRVIDVTDEVHNLIESYKEDGNPLGPRKLSYILESKYRVDTGLEPWLASMWSGSKYYMALYEVYSDVRLVAAPPVSSAAFGGDADNWEWPQHKCDFAMYRVYTAPDGSPANYAKDNIPMKSSAKLNISLDGYKEGDFTMIIGYPGSTNRYSSSYEVDFNETVTLPISNRIRGEQMTIIQDWMNSDPDIRLKYSDYYFNLSNIQELYSGQVECCERFDVSGQKAVIEEDMQKWIDESDEHSERWGSLLKNIEDTYSEMSISEKDIVYFRETLIRGTRLGLIMRRAYNSNNPHGTGKKMLESYSELDLRVERDLMEYALDEFINNIDSKYFTPYQKDIMAEYTSDGVCDVKALSEYLWENSIFTSEEGISRMFRKEATPEEIKNDPLCRFTMEIKISDFNNKKIVPEIGLDINELNKEFTRALYQMRLDKGISQYPDANSTMRITYGTVGTLEPRDGVICDWKTTPAGILEKYNPADYEFNLNDRQFQLYSEGDWGRWGTGENGSHMYVNFLTDNDITGGNSGSPVLNAKGELIGLAFDGNKESLSSDVWCQEGYNKCVCVDIRYILWTLDRYAGMTRIIEELGL